MVVAGLAVPPPSQDLGVSALVAGRVVVNITLVAGATLVAVASMATCIRCRSRSGERLVFGASLHPVQV